MPPGSESTAIAMAHSGQSACWGVCVDFWDRDDASLSAVPVTQQAAHTLCEALATCHNLSFIH